MGKNKRSARARPAEEDDGDMGGDDGSFPAEHKPDAPLHVRAPI